MAGEQVFVVGAGNSAGQAAVHLAHYAAQVTMIVRGTGLTATMSDYLVKTIESTRNIAVRLRTRVVDGHGDGRLKELVLQDDIQSATTTVPAAALFVLIGAKPHTDWLPASVARDDRGFILTGQDVPSSPRRKPLQGVPLPLETTMSGVFAIGDARHGSVKRVASAVGEGSIAIRSIHQHLSPGT
jgi:thioredoxin reductase (NADPH)